jgi:dephospho-CoA kinase
MSKMIGLTGGIGAGKTMVAKIFEQLGVPVFNADETAKQLMQTSPAITVSYTHLRAHET